MLISGESVSKKHSSSHALRGNALLTRLRYMDAGASKDEFPRSPWELD